MTDLADRLQDTPADVEQDVTSARALLRPRLRLRDHAGHGLRLGRPDVDAPRRGARHPHRAVVGVGVLRVAGQHRGLRRGDRARRAAVGHGRDAHRVAGRPARLRRRRGDLRRRLPGRARAAPRGLRDRLARRSAAALRRRAHGDHDAAGLPAHRRRRRAGRHRAGAHVGGGAGGGLRRPGRARDRGLARRGQPLLRAPRPGHHHRPGRVDRRPRRRGGGARARRGHHRRRAAGGGGGGRAVVGVLRLRRAGRRARPARGAARRAGAHRARLLHLPAPADGGRDRALRRWG